MTKHLLIVLAVLACSAPSEAPAQAEPLPVHGRAVLDAEYIGLVQAATTGMAAYGSDRTGCGTGIPLQPSVCARQIVQLADALVVELRRSENWPR